MRFLQRAKLHTPLHLAFQCLVLREKEIALCNNVLARIRSAEQDRITISPNSDITINGYTIPYHPVCGMLTPTMNLKIPNDLDIEPILVTHGTKARYGTCVY